jgi:hypothetical protein
LINLVSLSFNDDKNKKLIKEILNLLLVKKIPLSSPNVINKLVELLNNKNENKERDINNISTYIIQIIIYSFEKINEAIDIEAYKKNKLNKPEKMNEDPCKSNELMQEIINKYDQKEEDDDYKKKEKIDRKNLIINGLLTILDGFKINNRDIKNIDERNKRISDFIEKLLIPLIKDKNLKLYINSLLNSLSFKDISENKEIFFELKIKDIINETIKFMESLESKKRTLLELEIINLEKKKFTKKIEKNTSESNKYFSDEENKIIHNEIKKKLKIEFDEYIKYSSFFKGILSFFNDSLIQENEFKISLQNDNYIDLFKEFLEELFKNNQLIDLTNIPFEQEGIEGNPLLDNSINIEKSILESSQKEINELKNQLRINKFKIDSLIRKEESDKKKLEKSIETKEFIMKNLLISDSKLQRSIVCFSFFLAASSASLTGFTIYTINEVLNNENFNQTKFTLSITCSIILIAFVAYSIVKIYTINNDIINNVNTKLDLNSQEDLFVQKTIS